MSTITLMIHGPVHKPVNALYAWSVTCQELSYRAAGNTRSLADADEAIGNAAKAIAMEAVR